MATDQKKNTSNATSVKKPNSRKKGGVALVFLLFLIAGGVYGGITWKKYQTLKKSNSYLEQAKVFIEKRRFKQAEDTIEEANLLLPDRLETKELRARLENRKQVDQIEKELTIKLRERKWDESEGLLSRLTELDRDHPRLTLIQAEIKTGRIDDKRTILLSQLASAEKEDNLHEIARITENLVTLDPENSASAQWQEKNQKTRSEIKNRTEKAEALYQQALSLDQGVYNGETIFLAQQATSLSPDVKFKTFFEKVNSYPRDIYYPKDISTLQQAIDEARAIDTIYVAPGEHFASLNINKKITLLGEENKTTIIHFSGEKGPALFVDKEGEVEIKNLMFKHSEQKKDPKSAYSVAVIKGKASFTSCLFYESSGHGIHVIEGGKASLLSCRIEANNWDGIAASGKGCEAEVKNSITSNNVHHGVDVWDGAKLTFEDSFSEKNVRSGIVSMSGALVVVKGATLRRNSHSGLRVGKGGNATIFRSELSENQLAGGFGDNSASVKISESKILKNKIAGIVLSKGTIWNGVEALTFEGNRDKKIWKDAEFETLTDLPEVKPTKELSSQTPEEESSKAPAQE